MRADVTDTASPKLRAIVGRLKDLQPLMAQLGRHMMTSVRQNFDVGGRPAWEPLANYEVLPKGSRGGKTRRIQGRIGELHRSSGRGGPLVWTGDLRDSVDFTPEAKDLVLWAKPNPNMKGPVHQWGTDRAGRGRNVRIPARPYLVFQPEDLDWFRKNCEGWIRVGALP